MFPPIFRMAGGGTGWEGGGGASAAFDPLPADHGAPPAPTAIAPGTPLSGDDVTGDSASIRSGAAIGAALGSATGARGVTGAGVGGGGGTGRSLGATNTSSPRATAGLSIAPNCQATSRPNTAPC